MLLSLIRGSIELVLERGTAGRNDCGLIGPRPPSGQRFLPEGRISLFSHETGPHPNIRARGGGALNCLIPQGAGRGAALHEAGGHPRGGCGMGVS